MGLQTIISTISIGLPVLPSQLSSRHLAGPFYGPIQQSSQHDTLTRCISNSNGRGSSFIGFDSLNSRSIGSLSLRLWEPCYSSLVPNQTVEEHPGVSETGQPVSPEVKHILCLSNGHGEDTIAVSVLKELKVIVGERGQKIDIMALPLVGVGSAYHQNGIQTLGPSKVMPSGGFIYMDILQLLGDMRAGLVSLTIEQWQAIVRWLDTTPDTFIVAVGDIFPLTLAWLASIHEKKKRKRVLEYVFIGTAKSEFHIQNDTGSKFLTSKRFHVESLLGGVYLPWERAVMADSNCRLVAPRDGLTAEVLRERLPSHAGAKVQDLGNPMMDGLDPSGSLDFLKKFEYGHCIAILPGSRPPEVYVNWRLLLEAAKEVSAKLQPKVVVYITPIVPSLEPGPFYDSLVVAGWEPYWSVSNHLHSCHAANAISKEEHQTRSKLWPANNGLCVLQFQKDDAVMLLLRGGFSDACFFAQTAISMAGTGTEQLVGLGKPVFTLPGNGPQFTYAFAEAQSRLLGKSIFLCSNPKSLGVQLQKVLADQDSLHLFLENGLERMGSPGSSRRIANEILYVINNINSSEV
ncbi:hypothetical protein R1sor_005600 [Riccia sorocarpa]|uniref:Lipid-A-disaccharide synthase n=1 Tax=Riccia sorocarpa TaxID=122646 RepID=A0ABD3HNQ8_9MARC